ncbi:hypothetical protein HMPREF1597_05077, partial [Escherichia coli 907701]
ESNLRPSHYETKKHLFFRISTRLYKSHKNIKNHIIKQKTHLILFHRISLYTMLNKYASKYAR